MKNIIITIILILLFIFACTKQVSKQAVLTEDKPPVYFRSQGDTTTYVVEFSDKKEKRTFKKNFESFLENYSFKKIQEDTITQYFTLRIVPETIDTSVVSEQLIIPPDKTDLIEEDIEMTKEIPEEDTIKPIAGGKATIYANRKFMDNTVSELIQVIPFPNDTADTIPTGFLIVNQISPIKIKIICTDKLINNSGRHLTAFDIVQAWTDFVKHNPAEGLSLFSYVKGIKKFIKGEEGIIQGFSVINERTIRITLDKPDPHALQRLNSCRLFPSSLNIGQFYVKKQQGNKFLLHQNTQYPYNKSFLNRCTIICGNDKNPIVTYSLNKYDMLILYKKKDIEYARRSLLKNSHLLPFSTERYFISLASKSPELRQNLKKLLNPTEIQINAAKAEGELINAIESADQMEIVTPQIINPESQDLSVLKPLIILYNSNDPVSTGIAEKIFSDLSHSGISCKLRGLQKNNLEISLIDRAYDIAIGWVQNKIVTDTTEQLRLATIWFNNENNEIKRISENYEIPLFTINRYALCKKNIKFFKNRFSGIYREIE